MGFVFGIGSAFFFALSSVLIRIGQRHRTGDDGVLMTVSVNVVVLGLAASLAVRPPWSATGVVALLAAGVVGSVLGRSFNLRAVRMIGSTRSSAFITGTPVAAAAVGWIVLEEAVSPIEGFGGLLVIGGLLWLIRLRAGPAGLATGERVPTRFYVIAALAPMFFGTAFVMRKWGLQRFDSSVIGAFLGATAAFAVLMSVDVIRGAIRDRIAANVHAIPWWFVAAGVTTSIALLSQFSAFAYLPAWVVGILQATQGIWAIGLGMLFLKGDEHVDWHLMASVALVVSGVVLIGIQ
ncbi:MAG TPA: DMT family transporter [Acidimicrobiia bacterium]|nr:DMT family transporter [Acidimicrobiia bacterium]